MKNQTPNFLSTVTAALLLTGWSPAAQAQSVLAEWNFNQTAGTSLAGISNSAGSQSSAWGALVNADGTTSWKTTGTGDLRLSGNNANANTIVQSVASLSGINSTLGDPVRFEWDLSWSLTGRPSVIQETYLIIRDGGGVNRFRWSLSNPNGTAEDPPLFRLNVDGNGFAAINNVTATQHGTTLNGPGGSLLLRTDFTFDATGVARIDASYSYNGEEFETVNLGTFTPYNVANLNDVRLHSKGALNETNYIEFNSISVSTVPEPGTWALLALAGVGLGAFNLRRR